MQVLLLQEASGDISWQEAIVAVGGISMITVIVAVAIWQVFASWRARMSVAREDAYRVLAEESIAAQKHVGEGLERTATKLDELERRTAELERMLKDVG